MSKFNIAFMLAMMLLFVALFLLGCTTVISEAPERDEEYLRQCAQLNDTKTQKVLAYIKKSKAPKEVQYDADCSYRLSEAILEWTGHPEKEFSGNYAKLLNKMHDENDRYDRDIDLWKSDVLRYGAAKSNRDVLWLWCGAAAIVFLAIFLYGKF